MGLFNRDYKTKFIKLIAAIDERYKLYETLVTKGAEPHPPGLETVLQEFRNLKIKAWDIETGKNDAVKLIKDFTEEELRQRIEEKGDLK